MPYLAYDALEQSVWVWFFICVPIFLGLLIAAVAGTIAWGGRRAGMVVGVLALLVSLAGLGGLLLTAPHAWWIAVAPIGLSAAAIKAWYRHAGPATGRRLRFDLRTLFAVVLCAGLILGGITSQHRQTRVEEQAAAEIRDLPLGPGNVNVQWAFGRVVEVNFIGDLSPEDFGRAADAMERFSQLKRLQLGDRRLSPQVTRRLARLTTLRVLIAQSLPVTDDDLAPLASLRNLEYLDLNARGLTEAGFAHLAGLKRLRTLHLYHADHIPLATMRRFRAGFPHLDHP